MGDSSLGRLVGVLTSPSKAFQALRDDPRWVLPLLVLIIVAGGVSQYAQSKIDNGEMVRSFMERSGRDFSEADIEEAIAQQDGQSPAVKMVSTGIFLVVLPMLGALFFWIGTKVFGGDPTFKQSLATFVHAMVPWWVVKSVVSLPALVSRAEISFEDASSGGLLPSNLGFLMPEEASTVMKSIAASVDIFTIWSLILMVIGYSIVARVSKTWSILLAIVLWLVATGVSLIPALLFG